MRSDLTINGAFLRQQPVTGVQRYGREIVAELDRLLQDSKLKSSLAAKIVAPPGTPAPPLHAIAFEWTAAGGGPSWNQFALPLASRGVLLSLCNYGPLFASNHIVCLHDVNAAIEPESYRWAYRALGRIIVTLLARNATRVVTVSGFSARMLNNFGLCPVEKITVIPNGHEHVRRWRPSLSSYAEMHVDQRPFIFMLGSRARHKNVGVLFSIAKEIDALGLDIVVAGGPSINVFSTVDMGPIPPNVRHLGFVTDDDLAALFQNALCFAFPSLTEGFGLPALEALALNCPVIASNTGSLPEVCGNAALYADPTSPREWLDQIKRIRTESELVRMLRAEGPRQAKRFSWAKSAELYLDLILTL
ncbi:glycosyltransferase family 1 protein [Methylocapsa polymorpha]|uniref:Glycosyltransferase family 1 protein n=1 Tax=Methylocapsa polymorpha TaxID=3080828 RepID=A0ABZ0HVC5_9HYPH|nr:glycosyltransferase family 1 protein [Methylocapsa sp. RX1]